jgi:hypothetical protein
LAPAAAIADPCLSTEWQPAPLDHSGCNHRRLAAGHADGIELLFERTAESLQAAISSAISDVERAGYRVSKIEMEREALPV